MQIIEIDINKILPNKYNPNQMTDKQFKALIKSIELYGQVRPVICKPASKRGFYEIIDGEHTLKAMKHLKQDKINIISINNLSDKEAKALTVALDRIRGDIQNKDLEKIFREVSEKFDFKTFSILAQYDFKEIEKQAEKAISEITSSINIKPKTEKKKVTLPEIEIPKNQLGTFLWIPTLIKQSVIDFIKAECLKYELDYFEKEIDV